MYCSKCGTQNPDEVRFCGNCGTPFGTAPAAAVPIMPQTSVIPKTSGLAIAALVLGILSFFCALTAIPAIICGIISLVKIEKSGGKITGKGLAITGIITPVFSFALLMVILMPALQRVKEQAMAITCRANLRQYGIAQVIYLDDNDGRYPSARNSLVETEYPVPDYQRSCRWHDPRYPADGPIWPYLPEDKVHLCPTFRSLAKSEGQRHPGHDPSIPVVPYYSYSMNAFLGSSSLGNRTSAKKISDITRSHSEVFFFAEENMWIREGCNYVLNDNAICPDGRDWFGTYHSTKSRNLNRGKANVVFVDGHVEEVSSALKDEDPADNSEKEFGEFEKYGWPYKNPPSGL
jgi:prepilin-type processing-associated H-X9-DG protein